MEKERYEYLASQILDSAIEVHKIMGPGLLESVYEYCLWKELNLRNIYSQRQKDLPLYYKNLKLDKDFRIDLLVENEIIVEIKSVEVLHPVHESQIISYLKLADKRMGFLINFNTVLLKNAFRRYVNQY